MLLVVYVFKSKVFFIFSRNKKEKKKNVTPTAGFEPTRPKASDFKSDALTTPPCWIKSHEMCFDLIN